MTEMTRMDQAMTAAWQLNVNLNLTYVEATTASTMLQLQDVVARLTAESDELQLKRQFMDMLHPERPSAITARERQIIAELAQRQIELIQLEQTFVTSGSMREEQLGISA